MIRAALVRLGIPRDAPVMVHSSLALLSREGIGPLQAAEILTEYFETLLMPAMSWRNVKPEHPNWHELDTPSCVGILSEVFRTAIATYRSIHPTHSVCGIGPRAAGLLSEHHLDSTPCSARSPFGKLCADGWVLLLGIGIDCCTNVYLRNVEIPYDCEARDGTKHVVLCRKHKLLPRDYWQFQDRMARRGNLRTTQIGAVTCRAFRAADLHTDCADALLHNPNAIIAHDGGRYRRM